MSTNIRKQLGPVRKSLQDRIKEAFGGSDEKDVSKLHALCNKLFTNIESHEKVYFKFDGLDDLTKEEQEIVYKE